MRDRVLVSTGARLHFGPLAVRAAEGRQFGGMGLMVDAPRCVLEIAPSETDTVLAGAETERIVAWLAACRKATSPAAPPCRIELRESIPAHAGFGSGTQLALALARGLAEWWSPEISADLSAAELARRVGRGGRSAIGLHGFEQGGLLIDGGKSAPDSPGALACRADVPEVWRFVLVTPASADGLSGIAEQAAFDMLEPMPPETTAALCRIVLLQLLPAVHESDFDAFAQAIAAYGARVGDYFRPVQGGRFAAPRMSQLADELHAEGRRGVAQTSWGPTIAVCCPDLSDAETLRDRLARDASLAECSVRIAAPRNHGVQVTRGR